MSIELTYYDIAHMQGDDYILDVQGPPQTETVPHMEALWDAMARPTHGRSQVVVARWNDGEVPPAVYFYPEHEQGSYTAVQVDGVVMPLVSFARDFALYEMLPVDLQA